MDSAFIKNFAPLSARIHTVLISAVMVLGFSTAAHAQLLGDTDTSLSSETKYGLGIAAVVRQHPYIDAGRKTSALPVLYLENRWLHVMGGNADLNVWRHAFAPSNSLSAGLRMRYESEGYEESDAPILTGMEERKSSFWGGGSVIWSTPWARFTADYLADLSRESKGKRLILQADRRFSSGVWGFTPRLRAQWLDKKYVDYYYGVPANEVTAERSLYTGQSARTFEAGLRIDYTFERHHMIYVDTSITSLPDEITQSPIVGRSHTSRIAAGYMYRF